MSKGVRRNDLGDFEDYADYKSRAQSFLNRALLLAVPTRCVVKLDFFRIYTDIINNVRSRSSNEVTVCFWE